MVQWIVIPAHYDLKRAVCNPFKTKVKSVSWQRFFAQSSRSLERKSLWMFLCYRLRRALKKISIWMSWKQFGWQRIQGSKACSHVGSGQTPWQLSNRMCLKNSREISKDVCTTDSDNGWKFSGAYAVQRSCLNNFINLIYLALACILKKLELIS